MSLTIRKYIPPIERCSSLPNFLYSILLDSCSSILPPLYFFSTPFHHSSVHPTILPCFILFLCCILSLSLRSSVHLLLFLSSSPSLSPSSVTSLHSFFHLLLPLSLLPSILLQVPLSVLPYLVHWFLLLFKFRSLHSSVFLSHRSSITSHYFPFVPMNKTFFAI